MVVKDTQEAMNGKGRRVDPFTGYAFGGTALGRKSKNRTRCTRVRPSLEPPPVQSKREGILFEIFA
jgi:hypothetical protein